MTPLERGQSAADLAIRLDEFLRGGLRSAAFAVTGPWGAGKTTLLQDALSRVAPKTGDRLSLVEFTPWMYANEDAIFEGFAVMLLQETLQRGKARKRIAAGLRILSAPLQALPVDASASAQALASMVDVAYTPEQIRASLASALEQQERRVLLVVDDLDRLDPDELLRMFKLLRLISDVPGLAYLLAFDEDTLLHLLQQTAIGHGSRERARQYLEKLIQRRVDVPPLTVDQMLGLLQPALDAMPSKQYEEDGLGSFRLDVLFESRLTTPRSIERFAQALADIPVRLAGEVDHWDLCSAVFLRMFFPDVWAIIVRERRTLTADHRGFADYFGDGPKLRATEVQARLAQVYSGEPDGSDLRQLVDHLFPALTSLAAGHEPSRSDRRGQRIGNPDYIDRYLWLDLPPGSISDGEIRDQLRNLATEHDAQVIVGLIAKKPSTGMTVLERALRDQVVNRSTVFRVLDAGFAADTASPRNPVAEASIGMARSLLLQCQPEEFSALLAEHGGVTGWPLLRYLFTRDRSLQDLAPQVVLKPVLEQARADLLQHLVKNLEHAASPSVVQEQVREDWFDLRRLGGPAEAVARGRFISQHWTALDIASLGLRVAHDSAGPFVSLDVARLRRLLGEELIEQLQKSALPPYPAEFASTQEWRLREPLIDPTLADQITSYVLTTGDSFGEDPFADRLL